MFIISVILALFALILTSFANHVIADTLTKNHYTAEKLMQDDYNKINPEPVVKKGGGVQVINSNYEIVFSAGINTFKKDKLTAAEFTDFLTTSKSKGVKFSYDIKYNSNRKFWLLVTFPTFLRIDFAVVHNEDYPSYDTENLIGAVVAIIMFYLLLLVISTVIYSKITSFSIINPLRALCDSARRLRDGDYSARVDYNLKNEFGELQDTFNAMANQIEQEISLRKESEENRKKMVLDISHDLKNPLASIMGYAELCRKKQEFSKEELDNYLRIIYENSVRANNLITDMFELSKLESSEFSLNLVKTDVCEYLREEMGAAIPVLDEARFIYDFDIPEEEIFAMVDTGQMDRVFQNLITNTVKYNPEGTKVEVNLWAQDNEIFIIFKDNGVGIPKDIAKDIFKPFVRVDSARNSRTGGTGLGLAIVDKIITAHSGSIKLKTDKNCGCEFIIRIPKI
jgi:signal transduction histidine kinase